LQRCCQLIPKYQLTNRIQPGDLDHFFENERESEPPDSQGAKNLHPPINPDPFLENVPIGGDGDRPEDGNPFAEGTGNETPLESNSSEDPFNEPKERQPTSGSGTWDDPFVYPPGEEFYENAEDNCNPFREEEARSPELQDDTDPFHDHDAPTLDADGPITADEENDGSDGNDGNQTEAASDDAIEGDDSNPPDDPSDANDADASGDNGDDGGNDGGADGSGDDGGA